MRERHFKNAFHSEILYALRSKNSMHSWRLLASIEGYTILAITFFRLILAHVKLSPKNHIIYKVI
jgi:hypothetical protein